MIDVNYTDYAEEARITLSYSEVNYIVQFLLYYDCYDLPKEVKEKINKEILPKLSDFLSENY